MSPSFPVVVIGAGTMGVGIAQVAVAAGHRTHLVDPDRAQLVRAEEQIVARLLRKGVDEAAVQALLRTYRSLVEVEVEVEVASVAGAGAPLVVEAIVEDLAAKHLVLSEAQRLFGPASSYATNTSSFSVTTIAAGVPHPERVVGMHFFNPVPVMRLVEVVPGQQTAEEVTDRVLTTARDWGKSPILARSTPGFIVNRVARPYYGEALRLAEEGIAPIPVIDRLLRDGGTFRMGPFELMDLVGNDVNLTVTRTVWEGHHYDPRFIPSVLQGELVAAGRLGRKSGAGFYDYTGAGTGIAATTRVEVSRGLRGEDRDTVLTGLLRRLGLDRPSEPAGDGTPAGPGIRLLDDVGCVVLTRGRTAAEESVLAGVPVLVLDRPLDVGTVPLLAYSVSHPGTDLERLVRGAASDVLDLVRVRDLPGLVVARVVAMLVNEAAETVHLRLCSADDVDTAMRLGTNYPLGLLEWGDRWTAGYVAGMVGALGERYQDPRYRTSLLLRETALRPGALLVTRASPD